MQEAFLNGFRWGGYDAVAGVATRIESRDIPWLAPGESRRIAVADLRVQVTAVSDQSAPESTPATADRPAADLHILLCDGDIHFATAAARQLHAGVAVVSRGAKFDEPLWRDGVLYLAAGSDGRYVGECLLGLGERAIEVKAHRLRAMDASAGGGTGGGDSAPRLSSSTLPR